MKSTTANAVFLLTVWCLAMIGAAAHAAGAPCTPEGTLIRAEGDARTRVQNDFLSIDLAFERVGTDTARLHETMQKEAASAFEKARAVSSVKASTMGYSVYPVYEKSRIVRYRAHYRLLLETGNFAEGLALAAELQPFQIGNLNFSISPELRKQTEKTLIETALADLKEKFDIAAAGLGAREVWVTDIAIGGRHVQPIEPRMMRASMMAEAASPVAAEAGESEIVVIVSGTARVR